MDQTCKNSNMMVLSGGSPGLRGTTLATGEERKDNHNSSGIDDADGTNPSGHLPADVANSELRCTKVTKIGTWNVRGMNIGKLDTIKKEMNRLNIDILGVSEVHWTGNGFFNSGDHTMYFSVNIKTRQHGVGFVLYKKITMSDRVITIRIKAKPNNITLLQMYAPTADAEENEIEQFYAEIQSRNRGNTTSRCCVYSGRFQCQNWRKGRSRHRWQSWIRRTE
ncbi:craniofacial development protein 2-like [Octopus sinensis]|uniref:Craniofacial development protein 2-like n=1 Tax=Octopus sinensis TaxID=2607531 RepID=A0A6P7U2S1_9MOLL|nr:craniofacial development protein 2-like [Octopus sinensis]